MPTIRRSLSWDNIVASEEQQRLQQQPQRSHELTPQFERVGAHYAIIWRMDGQSGMIFPKRMYGMHSFLAASKLGFAPGQGSVGRIWSQTKQVAGFELIPDISVVANNAFLRKHEALANGIMSILFVRQPDGALLEAGFESFFAATTALTALRAEYAAPCSAGSRCDFSKFDLWAPRPTSSASISGNGDLDNRHPTSYASGWSSPLTISTAAPSSIDVQDEILQPPHPSEETSQFAAPFRVRSFMTQDGSLNGNESTPNWLSEDSMNSADVASLGTVGHPANCRPACKYMWTKAGCTLGQACDHCHLCFRRRKFHRRQWKNTEQQIASHPPSVEGA